MVFLFVAQRGACTQKDIEIGLSRPTATISRIVSWWCEQRIHGVNGVGFLRRVEDPRNRRYRIISLTSAGEEFYKKIKQITRSEQDFCSGCIEARAALAAT